MPNPNSAVVRPLTTRRRGFILKNMRSSGSNAKLACASAATAAIEALEQRQHLSVSQDSGGWTHVTPQSGDRVVYVSSSSGSDSNSGLGATSPVRSLAKAKSLLRSGAGDEMLLKRGDTWHEALGFWNISGQSASNPALIGAYGTGARPTLATGNQIGMVLAGQKSVHDLDIIGIHFDGSGRGSSQPDGISSAGGVNGLLVEDCQINNYRNNITLESFFSPIYNFTLRRSVVTDSYSPNSHSQGLYADGVRGVTLQDNVFDHNGWGHGASQTLFNHDAYVTANSSNLTATNNIFANASSHGLQARCGGTVTGNLFANDAIGLSFGLVNGGGVVKPGGVTGVVSGNVFTGGHSINGLPAGVGMEISNVSSATISNNLFTTGDPTARNAAINLAAIQGTSNGSQAVGIHNLTIANNVVYKWSEALQISGGLQAGGSGPSSVGNLVVRNNAFQNIFAYQAVVLVPGFTGSWSGNTYDVPNNSKTPMITGGKTLSLASWKSYESSSQNVRVNYPAATRSLASYAGSMDSFLAGSRNLSSSNWDSRYQARGAIAYFDGGFGMSGGSSSTISNTPASTPTPSPTPTATPSRTPVPARTVTPLPTPSPTPAPTPSSNVTPVLTIKNVSVSEGNSGTKSMTFTLSLSSASSKTTSIQWSTESTTAKAGSDFNAASGKTTFAPGQTSRTVSVAIKGDRVREANETFNVHFYNYVGVKLGTIRAKGTILNDD